MYLDEGKRVFCAENKSRVRDMRVNLCAVLGWGSSHSNLGGSSELFLHFNPQGQKGSAVTVRIPAGISLGRRKGIVCRNSLSQGLWVIGKNSDAGRDWGQEEKETTEDEMGRWHHRLDGREFGWTLGVGGGQGGLACCNSWGRKESDTTERLNWPELMKPPYWIILRVWFTACRIILKLNQDSWRI